MTRNATMLLVVIVLLVSAAYGQNSCVYKFTFAKPSFAFCLTDSGTLAMLQYPIGVDHLDPTNPVEGWAAIIRDADGGGTIVNVVPGVGMPNPAAVRQPNGPGTLPIIFDYGDYGQVKVTAASSQRTITFRWTIRSCKGEFWQPCVWWGSMTRMMNPRLDGGSINGFVSSPSGALAYSRHGIVVDGGNMCSGTDSAGVSGNPSLDCSTPFGTAFIGSGAIWSAGSYQSVQGSAATVTTRYRVF